jgi:phosphatidylinositol alpha 1,6-mannosyltransferase
LGAAVHREQLRVALFTGNFNYTPDGATKALGRLVDHLRQVEGAKVRIYAPTAPDAPPQSEELVSIPSVPFPVRREYRLGLGLSGAVRDDVVGFAPNVFHLATPDLVGFQALRLARQLGRPVVSSLHTRFETYLAFYGLAFLEPVLEQGLMSFYRRCDYVLTPTPSMAETMAAGGLAGRTRVWGRGVDRALFSPERRCLDWRRARGFTDDDVVVLFFGRVVLEKGLALFADAFDRLSALRPGVRALVVGDGPARSWLEQRLPGAVFTGFLQGPELACAVASADVLLNPSVTETFGNVTLEAMASGLPAVCADLPNSHALIADGRTGLLCPAAGASAYVEALLRLADDGGLRRRIASAARAASAGHAWAAALSSVVQTYRDAIDGEGAEDEAA